MQHVSTITVLTVEREERTSKRTNNTYQHFAARVILLNDDGQPVTVGLLQSRRISPELRDSIQPGTYRAAFSLHVPDFGEDKGDVISQLTALTPIQLSRAKPAATA